MMSLKNIDRVGCALLSRRLSAPAALLCGVVALSVLGGCDQQQMQPTMQMPAMQMPQRKELPLIRNESEFQQYVLESKQPVIVEFSKDECPTCVVLEPVLVDVSKEYVGRARFCKFMLLNAFFQHYSPTISETFKLQLVPTAVLFVNGQERQRWFMDYNPDTYRSALTELVGPPATPRR
jgi:thioredoxin 1